MITSCSKHISKTFSATSEQRFTFRTGVLLCRGSVGRRIFNDCKMSTPKSTTGDRSFPTCSSNAELRFLKEDLLSTISVIFSLGSSWFCLFGVFFPDPFNVEFDYYDKNNTLNDWKLKRSTFPITFLFFDDCALSFDKVFADPSLFDEELRSFPRYDPSPCIVVYQELPG